MFAEYSLNGSVVLYQSSPTRINQIIRQSSRAGRMKIALT